MKALIVGIMLAIATVAQAGSFSGSRSSSFSSRPSSPVRSYSAPRPAPSSGSVNFKSTQPAKPAAPAAKPAAPAPAPAVPQTRSGVSKPMLAGAAVAGVATAAVVSRSVNFKTTTVPQGGGLPPRSVQTPVYYSSRGTPSRIIEHRTVYTTSYLGYAPPAYYYTYSYGPPYWYWFLLWQQSANNAAEREALMRDRTNWSSQGECYRCHHHRSDGHPKVEKEW